MTNQERLALADRVQQCIQEKLIQFWIMSRKEKIEREFQQDRDVRQKY